MIKLIFKAYKKTDKLFLYAKMLTGYYKEKTKKASKKDS